MRTVFTNGCFDIIHPGHIDLLRRARLLGDRLIVAINSDESIRRTKGGGRPFIDQESRRQILLSLRSVDDVVVFDEQTPARIINEIMPDVLVKGGDWAENEIVGADIVKANGGEVHSLPLLEGFSSSKIVAAIRSANDPAHNTDTDGKYDAIAEHLDAVEALNATLRPQINETAGTLFHTFRSGRKVLICGNGGSAADSQHLAAEFTGRYESERKGLPAIALTTDTSALTALANDYSFERVFSRQIEALACEGDCLIAISTSGTSPNIIAAVMAARSLGCTIIGLTGANGRKLAALTDQCIMVPSARTSRIQECHILIAHLWCEIIDALLAEEAEA